MKLIKILALIMAVCLLGTAFIACDNGDKGNDSEDTTAATTTVKINLVIKDGSTTKYEDEVTCKGTLGEAIEIFAAGEGQETDCFDENGILKTILELEASGDKRWSAYYEDEGQSKAFDSIKDQKLIDGKTVCVVLG